MAARNPKHLDGGTVIAIQYSLCCHLLDKLVS